jgi:citrate synthase
MTKTANTHYWDQRRGTILSRKGGWKLGKGISLHGYSLLDDLLGQASFFQVLILSVTGRLPEPRYAQWLEATFICMSWPDPRIWCNQVSAFGGDLRASTSSAIAAGIMSSDSTMYGPGASLDAIDFIQKAYAFTQNNGSVEKFIEQHAKTRLGLKTPGFGRPIAQGDERVAAMIEYTRQLGFEEGPHFKLAIEIESYLQTHYQESLNLAGYMSAFASDQGYNKLEMHRMITICVSGGLHSCFTEERDQLSDSFLPLRCNDIEYTGPTDRTINNQGDN